TSSLRGLCGLNLQLREVFVRIFLEGSLAAGAADEDSASGDVDGDRTAHRIQVQAGDWTNLLPGRELHVLRRQRGSLFEAIAGETEFVELVDLPPPAAPKYAAARLG